MRILVTILIVLVMGNDLRAQDPQFTQFYAAPLYLNPAFAGTSVQSRLSANYRNQWPAIPGGWVTYAAGFDHYAPMINSGFGLMATRDQAGSGALRNTSISGIYSYEARIRKNLFIRPALQFSYVTRGINFNDLTFGDQLIREDGEVTLEAPIGGPVNYFDFATGFLVTTPKIWFGAAAHHINEPNESLYGQNIAPIPMKISVHGGYRHKFESRFGKNKSSGLVAFNYKKQADFDQLDLGVYFEIHPVVLGLWYRGLFTKSNGYGHPNHDAVSLVAGWHSGRYKFGYSYDITVSQLGVGASAGAHEISISYEWANKRNKKLSKRRIIPCAKF